jgi:hypothetical protein
MMSGSHGVGNNGQGQPGRRRKLRMYHYVEPDWTRDGCIIEL